MNLKRLNPNQQKAVLHGQGPLLILAGAGSGKTSTMSYRIAHLIAERGVPAENILGLSFTNKAARELKERVRKLVTQTSGAKASKGLTITTFHSLGARMLRAHAEKLGFKTNFTIADTSDQRDVLKQIFKNVRIDDRKFDHDFLLSQFSQAKGKFLDPSQAEAYFLESGALSGDYGIAAATAYPKYIEQLKLLNSMDFDDLQYYAVKLLEEHADVRELYNRKFKHISVDEYQDTNPTQFRILELLTQAQQNLCVVGDDDQSIYSWRGADASHILGFATHFREAKTIVLDQNYRSTARILEAANAVIKNNRKRHLKSLWSDRGEGEPLTEVVLEDDREEAEYLAEEINRRAKERTLPWKDFAILYRSNSQSRVFEEALRRHKIPYKIVGGSSFLERKEVKNALAYWKIILNPSDDASLRRILNWPARGIGKSSLEILNDSAFKLNTSLLEALGRASEIAPRAASGSADLREKLSHLSQQLLALPADPVALSEWGKQSLDLLGVKKALFEDEEDPLLAARKWENVEELFHSLGQIRPEEGGTTAMDLLKEFLGRLALEAQDDEKEELDDDANQVTLLTLHGAKGLEYPIVFLVGMEEGFLPHKRSIEGADDLSEERRLAYVGITRAKDHLILTRAKHRIRYGKPVPRNRSRFIEEIPAGLILQVNKALPDAKSSEDERQAHEDRVKNHLAMIRAQMRGSP